MSMPGKKSEEGPDSELTQNVSEEAAIKTISSKTMSRNDAHRALELLEEYYGRLVRPQDQNLRLAIERVIRIFKSRLFQALLDIQEFYEVTLLDDEKTVEQKTDETLLVASRWEDNPPIASNRPLLNQQRLTQTTTTTNNNTIITNTTNNNSNSNNNNSIKTDSDLQQQSNAGVRTAGRTCATSPESVPTVRSSVHL